MLGVPKPQTGMTRLLPCARSAGVTLFAVAIVSTGCPTSPSSVSTGTRSFRMGFSGFPPRPDVAQARAALDMWTQRADAAIFHVEPPWALLLGGGDLAGQIATEYGALASYYRGKGLTLYVTFDVTDGLSREREARPLREAGRSVAEPAVQQAFTRYVLAFVQAVRPDYVGVGAEVNLIRAAAPRAVYDGVRTMCNAAAAQLVRDFPSIPLYATVQVETVWGRLQQTNAYSGIDQDLRDFPYAKHLGLSLYPYLGRYAVPEDIPNDYLARIANDAKRPVFVAEGGWTTGTAFTVVSSPALQARYVARLGRLLNGVNATALLHLQFTDVDARAFHIPAEYAATLALFTNNGLVDADLNPKSALGVWDSVFASRRNSNR